MYIYIKNCKKIYVSLLLTLLSGKAFQNKSHFLGAKYENYSHKKILKNRKKTIKLLFRQHKKGFSKQNNRTFNKNVNSLPFK